MSCIQTSLIDAKIMPTTNAIRLACLFSILVFLFPVEAKSQITDQQRERRKAFVGDLLKTLIESQMERDPVPTQPGRPNLRPVYPGLDSSDPRRDTHRPSKPLTPGMIAARTSIQSWESESDRFVRMLRNEERRLPKVRPYLADALSLNAQIKSLRANMGRVHTLDPLTDSFCRIDADWRLLNHQLSQVSGLRAECTACLSRMSSFDADLCRHFGVQPQFNRRQLERYCTQMATGFQHLIQDVRYDMAGDPQFGAILAQCQSLHARLNESGHLIRRGNYDAIVRLYKRSVKDWRRLKYKLIECPHGRIHRNVHSIESIGGHIAELLWIPVEMDREYLRIVLESMQRDTNLAFEMVTMKDLVNCPNPGLVLASARDFQNQCSSFASRLRTNVDADSLQWDFRQFSNQWNDLNVHLTSFRNPRIRQAVGEVDSGFQVLRSIFGNEPFIDHTAMTGICAELDQLSYRLHDLIELRMIRGYDPTFRSQVSSLSRDFRDSIHQMHEHAISSHRHHASAPADVAMAFEAWSALRPLLNQCKPAERQVFRDLRGQIEPLMVKLQIVYSQ